MTFRPAQMARKASDTSRNTTTTPTADPDLKVKLAKGITYELDIKLLLTFDSAVPGFQCLLDLTNFDSTISSIHQMVIEDRVTGNLLGDTNNGAIWGGFHTIVILPGAGGGSTSWKMFIQGQYGVSADTLVALLWAQQASSADNVKLLTGSTFRALPLT